MNSKWDINSFDFLTWDLVWGLILIFVPNIMWLAALITCFFVFYVYSKRKLQYWQKLGVKYREPNLLFGNFGSILTLQESLGQAYSSWYNEFKNAPYVGYYKIHRPGVLVRDAELIKDILIKDFNSFGKNDMEIDEENDPLLAKNPFCQAGEAWKRGRGQITPAFSISKVKLMLPLIDDVCKKLVAYINKENSIPIETRELCAKFTTDNVATCAFGLDGRSFEDPNTEFRKMGNRIFDQSLTTGIKIILVFVLPFIAKLLKIQVIPSAVGDYFCTIVNKTLKYRKENHIVRNDFLYMMEQLRKNQPDISDLEITAHAVAFFGDGFQTSSSAMSFALYCIARHPEIQEKLRNHIQEVLNKHDGQMTYEAVQDMNYLEMALFESMRLFPPIMSLTKICTKPYILPPVNNDAKEVLLTPGTPVAIAVYGLHRDPKYFPDPEKYNPERFTDENKQSIQKGSYLPLGEGPRVCLGQRFGLLQVEMGLAEIVRNFNISVDKKTHDPLKLDPAAFITGVLDGMWLNYNKI